MSPAPAAPATATASARAATRWRARPGEEARLTFDGAEIHSRDLLPLRVREESLHHARPGFPGTAVVLGDDTYEVISEAAGTADVVYRLRPWPQGEVVRQRVVYDPAFVAAAEQDRALARVRARARPWRPLLYPLVGLLPEDEQQRACDRLGLYSITATIVAGVAESAAAFLAIALAARHADRGAAVAMVVAAPGLAFFILPGIGRAASAWFFHQTAGSPIVTAALAALRAIGALQPARREPRAPLTRRLFWQHLRAGDTVEPLEGGCFRVSGRLPHLTWTGPGPVQTGENFWRVVALPPEHDTHGRLYGYRLEPLADETADGAAACAPSRSAYTDAVMGQVRYEWDGFNRAFAALTCMLGAEVQSRAFDHRGGAAAARPLTFVTSAVEALLGLYLLSFLPGPPADPLAPVAAACALGLLADALQRAAAARAGRYAPSLLRWLLPSACLRPERIAYQAHREAEQVAEREGAAARARG